MKKILLGLMAVATMINANAQVNSKTKTKVKAGNAKVKLSGGAIFRSEADSFSYAVGMSVAKSMLNAGAKDINVALLSQGMNDVITKSKTAFTEEQANMTLQKKLQEYSAKKSEAQKAEGKAFLEVNKKRNNIIVLENGIQYEIIKAGDPNGIKPKAIDTVVVNYVGTLVDGTEFDNSLKRGQPASFALNRVIKGWTDILQHMTKGAHWKVYIPSELGYGENPPGPPITPNAVLIFEIMLEDVKPAVTPPAQ